MRKNVSDKTKGEKKNSVLNTQKVTEAAELLKGLKETVKTFSAAQKALLGDVLEAKLAKATEALAKARSEAVFDAAKELLAPLAAECETSVNLLVNISCVDGQAPTIMVRDMAAAKGPKGRTGRPAREPRAPRTERTNGADAGSYPTLDEINFRQGTLRGDLGEFLKENGFGDSVNGNQLTGLITNLKAGGSSTTDYGIAAMEWFDENSSNYDDNGKLIEE